MKRYLINASNLKAGGGIQVAQSICEQLQRYEGIQFYFVLSTYIEDYWIRSKSNVELYHYNIKHNFRTVLFGRDKFLDDIVDQKKIDAVLTVFGPSIWRPKVPHLCGFARAQLLLKDSPYYQRISWKERVVYTVWKWSFKRSSSVFYTENEYISRILEKFYKNIKVYTVSNYYNQVFDIPGYCVKHPLSEFDGITCLCVSSYYPHKNLDIMIGVSRILEKEHPELNFRFVLTFDDGIMKVPKELEHHFTFIGKVDVSECPNLYEQANIMFMPTLMECFTSTYPEAMRMEVPIVTTDLEFARGLCGDAACYYSSLDAESAAEAIYKVATDKKYASTLVINGKEQLKKFDNYEQRTEKLIKILEEIQNK